MTDDLSFLTIAEAGALLRKRELSAVDLTQAALARIDAVDGEVQAFLLPTPDFALLQARRADATIAAGQGGALTGIPVAIKDILSTRGVPTTCASRILQTYVPQYDATVIRRLWEAGAVMVGKTNMDEFAMGSSTENSAFHPTRNPWDLERVPGGSSGGSAAAVAAGMALAALGTDTGGSIRQPAALTGTVGLKPTYGRVSRFGVVAFASSLDQVGPFARTVEDTALMLQAIAGHDPRDSTSIPGEVPSYGAALTGDISGMRLGLPREYFSEGIDPGVRQVLDTAIAVFESLGASIQEVSLPHTEYGLSTYYVVSPAEAMANLARYDGVRYGLSVPGEDVWEMFAATRAEGFGREVKRRIILGTYALSAGYYDAYYIKAQKVRTLVRQDFDAVFEQVDALVTPTTPTTAFKLGDKIDDPLQMYLNDVFTVPASIAGICGMSVPAGLSEGLPVGIQLLARPLGEATLLRIGHAFQSATHHHNVHPALATASAPFVEGSSEVTAS